MIFVSNCQSPEIDHTHACRLRYSRCCGCIQNIVSFSLPARTAGCSCWYNAKKSSFTPGNVNNEYCLASNRQSTTHNTSLSNLNTPHPTIKSNSRRGVPTANRTSLLSNCDCCSVSLICFANALSSECWGRWSGRSALTYSVQRMADEQTMMTSGWLVMGGVVGGSLSRRAVAAPSDERRWAGSAVSGCDESLAELLDGADTTVIALAGTVSSLQANTARIGGKHAGSYSSVMLGMVG